MDFEDGGQPNGDPPAPPATTAASNATPSGDLPNRDSGETAKEDVSSYSIGSMLSRFLSHKRGQSIRSMLRIFIQLPPPPPPKTSKDGGWGGPPPRGNIPKKASTSASTSASASSSSTRAKDGERKRPASPFLHWQAKQLRPASTYQTEEEQSFAAGAAIFLKALRAHEDIRAAQNLLRPPPSASTGGEATAAEDASRHRRRRGTSTPKKGKKEKKEERREKKDAKKEEKKKEENKKEK